MTRKIPVELDLDTNQLIVQECDVPALEQDRLIVSWSDGTARLRVNRFVLTVQQNGGES